MDLKKIGEILGEWYPDNVKEALIIELLANDEQVIPRILKILDVERRRSKEMVNESNLLLGKSHIMLDNKKLNKDNFMQGEIIEHFKKYSDVIRHPFLNLEATIDPPLA